MNKAAQMTRWVTFLWTVGTILLLTRQAQGHIMSGEAGGFVSGLKHPWSGADHICAMVAVGLWGAQLGLPAIWVLPVTFPMVMAVGGFMGLVDLPLPGVEFGIAISAILLGMMVLLAARPPLAVAMILVGIFGLYHGHAHGHELPVGENGLLYSMGFVMATGTLHALGIGIGLVHRWKAGKVFLRTAGAAIAVAGMVFLVQAFGRVPEGAGTKPAAGAGVPSVHGVLGIVG
jgi:urease accessory protein